MSCCRAVDRGDQMAGVTRDVVFGKMGVTAMRILQGAHAFARARRDGYIEPLHWLEMCLREDACDVSLLLDRLGIRREPLQSDIARALEGLRQTRSSRLDFSSDLLLAVERGWISASLVLGEDHIRTGHLLHGMLDWPELRRLLVDISGIFRTLDAAALAERFQELTRGSVEEAEAGAVPSLQPGAAAAPRGASGLDAYTTDLTEQARRRRASTRCSGRDARDPPGHRHPDAPPAEQPDPHRRGRRRQDRGGRGLRAAHRRAATCRRRCKDVQPARARPRAAAGRRRREGRVREPAAAGHRRGAGLADSRSSCSSTRRTR